MSTSGGTAAYRTQGVQRVVVGRHQIRHLTRAHIVAFPFRPRCIGIPEPPVLHALKPPAGCVELRHDSTRSACYTACTNAPPHTRCTKQMVAARRTSSAALSASSWFKAKCSTTGVSPGATPTCGRCSCAASVDSRPGSVDRWPMGAAVDTMRPLRSELCAANTVGACAMASATSASRAHPRVVLANKWRFISHNLIHKSACSQTLTQRSGLTNVCACGQERMDCLKPHGGHCGHPKQRTDLGEQSRRKPRQRNGEQREVLES